MKKGIIYAVFMVILLLGIFPSINQNVNHLYNEQINELTNLLKSPNNLKIPIEAGAENLEQPTLGSSSSQKISDYIDGTRIEILNDDDFGPSNYNFPGLGTPSNPYLIEGYSITDSSGVLIRIENTTAYFIIQNCILDGINRLHGGIYCKNVSSGIISNNILINNHVSCNIVNSDNNIIEDNMISASDLAIWFNWGSGNNSVINNIIQNTVNGISISPYSNSRIFDNTITEVTSTGISISSDSSGDVRNNTLSNIGGNGIYSGWATANVKIIGNKISNTSLASIELSNTHYGSGIVISNNTILNSKQQGILFAFNDDNVPITRNTIFNCTGYAIEFSADSDDNEIMWNNFFQNNRGELQVLDRGKGNLFMKNYWDDWTPTDSDTDGFGDMPYSINPDRTSLYFDGVNDYANLANFALNDIFTIELWVNVRDITKGQGIIGKHTSGGGNIFMLYISSGILQIVDSGGFLTLGPITTGWHHIAVVIIQNTTAYDYFVYQNGFHLINGSNNVLIGNNPSDKAWTLGQDWDGSASLTDFFNGYLDEIRFLNRSLSEAEIYSDYISSINGPYPARSETVAWYHIDEEDGSTILDSSGNNFDGQVIGAVWRSYPLGLYFDGVNDYGNLANFPLNTNFTIELWVNPLETAGGNCILGKHTSTGGNLFLLFILDGVLQIATHTDTFNTGPISTGWQHLTVVVNKNATYTTFLLYINGRISYTAFTTNHLNLGSGAEKDWVIGQDWDASPSDFLKGSINNVRFLNQTLSAQEIYEDYSYPYTDYPQRTDTVAWYYLNEQTNVAGTVIADYSGNDYNGTVIGYNYATEAWKHGILNFDTSPRVAPIWINDNDDFAAFSSSGNGTIDSPYILENYYLISDSTTLVSIYNTTAYFVLQNSFLDRMHGIQAIFLSNVSNGLISNNFITNSEYGIHLINTHHVKISSNEISYLYGEIPSAIYADSSHNNTFTKNTLWESSYGIYFHYCSDNIISFNRISQVSSGIYLYNSFNNSFYGNLLFNLNWNGIYLFSSDYNNFSWNKFVENQNYGLYLSSGGSSSDNNIFQWNYFFDNNPGGTSQVNNLGINNQFSYNYWNDHTSPDIAPADGIVDTPYDIDGGSSQDLYPRALLGPKVTIVSPFAQTYNVPKINISVTGNAFQYWYFIEGIDTQNHTWTTNTNRTVPDGTYTLHIYGSDPHGYITIKTVSFTIDFYQIVSPLAQEYGAAPVNISFSGYATHYWYYIEDVDLENQSWTGNIDRIFLAGSYTLHAYGNDSDGTIIHHSVNITVETTPPIINLLSPQNITYYQNIIEFIYTITDYDTYTIYLDGEDIPVMSGVKIEFPGIEDEGSHNITIEAIDHLGNMARTTIIFSIYIPPTLKIDSPLPKSYDTGSITITLSGDAIHYWYYIAGVDSSNQTWTADISRSLPAGTYTLHAYGNGSNGAIAHKSVTFTIDIPSSTTNPSTTLLTTSQQTTTTTSKRGSLPGFIAIILSLLPLAIIERNKKKG